MTPTMDTRHWIERAEAALLRKSLRMAELYMRRGLEEHHGKPV